VIDLDRLKAEGCDRLRDDRTKFFACGAGEGNASGDHDFIQACARGSARPSHRPNPGHGKAAGTTGRNQRRVSPSDRANKRSRERSGDLSKFPRISSCSRKRTRILWRRFRNLYGRATLTCQRWRRPSTNLLVILCRPALLRQARLTGSQPLSVGSREQNSQLRVPTRTGQRKARISFTSDKLRRSWFHQRCNKL
jgi:hypothetical protein